MRHRPYANGDNHGSVRVRLPHRNDHLTTVDHPDRESTGKEEK